MEGSLVTLNPVDIGLLLPGAVAVCLLAVSALVSGAETSFFSLTPHDIRDIKAHPEKSSNDAILRLLGDVDQLLATILVVNNLVNICIVILTSSIIDSVFTFLRFEFLFKTVLVTFLLLLFGAKRPLGIFFLEHFGVKLVMNWYSAIFASIVVAFPLMYRTARGAFESFDETLAWSAQTLGQSNAWIFWRVRMPCCRQGILAGTVLAFARALGEYGATSMIAGYTPGKTATIATTVYQLWRTNDEAGAMRWVLVDIVISAVVLLAVNLLEKKQKAGGRA